MTNEAAGVKFGAGRFPRFSQRPVCQVANSPARTHRRPLGRMSSRLQSLAMERAAKSHPKSELLFGGQTVPERVIMNPPSIFVKSATATTTSVAAPTSQAGDTAGGDKR